MNDYNNENNNYNQSYGQENGGECSYIYTPKNFRANKPSVKIGRYIILGVVSTLLIVMVILPGIALGSLAIKKFLKGSQSHAAYVNHSDGDPALSDHGISAVDVTSKNLYYYYRYGITSTGVIVTDSEYTDELELGDKIISVNGMDIYVSDDIETAVSECSAGDTVKVVVERGGEQITVDLTLREQISDYVDFG